MLRPLNKEEKKTLQRIQTETTEKRIPSIKKIILYADNARYYKNRDVEEYLKSSKITFQFLPLYSPNLNLIERLWKFMKKMVINNKYYEKPKEFRNKLFDFFHNVHIHKKALESLITNNFQILQAQ
jgi:transposase